MKLVLCIFEQLSGLKINFHKSEIYSFGKAKEVENAYKHILGCDSGTFPLKYLGIPIHFCKLKNSVWKPVVDQFEVKLISWIRKLSSYGDRLTLFNSVLTSLSVFFFI
jgi:hypothetical protein